MAAVFVGLWLTGTELNITSIMGMMMIVGIVTEVAIFYYSEYVDSPEHAGELDGDAPTSPLAYAARRLHRRPARTG